MKFPLIVCEHGDILVFSSVVEARDYLEPIDVRNNEYIAYDAEGALVDLSVVTEETKGIFGFKKKREKIEFKESSIYDSAELSEKIRNFLRETGNSLGVDGNLSVLVEELLSAVRFRNNRGQTPIKKL